MADDKQVAIINTGMMTSVGLSTPETAASVRASAMRFQELSWLDKAYEPFTAAVVMEDGLPDLADEVAAQPGMTMREARMLRLGTMPLVECLAPLQDLNGSIGLMLALPETRTKVAMDPALFLERYCMQTEGAFDLTASQLFEAGRAAGLTAIEAAAERIRSGAAPFALAGGIDTYCALHLLATLDAQTRVKSIKNLDGFVPGEGAGFLLLGDREAARDRGLEPMAFVSGLSEGFEEGHLESEEPYLGEGLASTLESFFQQRDGEPPIQEVFSSMNGESYWGKEWGVSVVRNQEGFAPELGMQHPADCLGDTGAACGALMVGLAALGMAQGYRRSPGMVYCSSDKGERTALAVTAA